MSDKIVTNGDLVALTSIVTAVQQRQTIRRFNEDGDRRAEARALCDQTGNFAPREANAMDLFVLVTLHDGMRETVMWPIESLIEEFRSGFAFIDYEE